MIQLVRVVDTEYGEPGIIRIRGVFEDLTDYFSNAKGASSPFAATQVLTLPGSTMLALLDIPTLRDADDGPGYYAAVAGFSPSWHGASVFISTDGGEEYSPLVSLVTPAPIGFARNALAVGPYHLWDEGNFLDVEIINDEELFSVSKNAALNGSNLAALGQPGRIELLIYRNAEQLSPRIWRLSRLVRGVKGTEWAIAGHKISDVFVGLNSTIERVEDELVNIGVARKYRAVSIGNSIEDAATKVFTDTGVSLKPLSPVDIRGAFDGGDNIAGSFRRRSRLMGRNGRDFYDPPLGEEIESYEIDILTDDETSVIRTLTATPSAGGSYISLQTFFYSSADQVTDWGAIKGTNLHLNVYQISAAVGRGYPGHAIIHPAGDSGVGAFDLLLENSNPMAFEDGTIMEREH